ncbi:MAG: ROK family transcriptional regulator [Bacteroidales bacterium]
MDEQAIVYSDPIFFSDPAPEAVSSLSVKKYLQKKSILNFLYQKKSLSNPEICRLTNMSSPSIQKLLRELIAEGLVCEDGIGHSIGGRRPVLFGLETGARYVIGITIGQETTDMAVFNLRNDLIGEIRTLDMPLQNDAAFIDEIRHFAATVFEDAGLNYEKVLGVGVAIPGLTDPALGSSFSYFNEGSESVRELFEARFCRPVFVDNDARVMALGELVFGSAKGKNHVLCLNIGSGIGMGVITNGRLYHGNSGFAGEFGHIRMEDDGDLCICGKRGCLETLASGKALEKLARQGISAGKLSAVQSMAGSLDAITTAVIIRAAREGDQFSIDLLQQIGEYLGMGLSILIHIFNPEYIIIGGKLSRAGQFIIDPIQQTLNRYTILKIKNDTCITTSTLGDKAAVTGAMALVMGRIFEDVQHGTKKM